jgi:hypothetical protein
MRIKRERTKGWKMPENARYVGRPTKWGNPFSVAEYGREKTIKFYEYWIDELLIEDPHFLDELRGKDLACFCSLDQPCHADILIRRLQVMAGAHELDGCDPDNPEAWP